MTKESIPKWGYQDAREFVRRRLGVSPKEAADVFAAMRDYILLAFVNGVQVVIPRLMTIHIRKVKGSGDSTVIRGFIKLSGPAKNFLNKYYEQAEKEEVKELLTRRTPIRKQVNEDFDKLRSANKLTPVLWKPNQIRDNFLAYLQHEFPHRQDWTHPISNKVHPHELIVQAIEDYRVAQPTNYRAFWGLWLGAENRHIIVSATGIEHSMPARWQHALDYIILMLEFPSLQPAVEEFIPFRYGGMKDVALKQIEEAKRGEK